MEGSRVRRVALIPGDGVGSEVVREGRRVLERLAEASGGAFGFEFECFPWGCRRYLETGRMMDAGALEGLASFDAIYFGAVGWPGVPDHVSLWGLRLAICQGFDQYTNVRPVRTLPGVGGPLRHVDPEAMNWVVVRENTEGEYAGIGGRNLGGRGRGKEVAVESALFTEEGCQRVARFAFELARERGRERGRRGRVTGVTKSNAQRHGMVLWDEVFERVEADYPGVGAERCLVDAMAARMVLRPETLDVVVASNLHADVLSDLGAALAGGLGVAASANLDPEGRNPSMFEPVHGSAPDIAGRGVANPIGAILSAGMMLEHLGLPEEAARVTLATEGTTRAGVVTPDLGGRSTTREVGDAVLARLS